MFNFQCLNDETYFAAIGMSKDPYIAEFDIARNKPGTVHP